VEGVGEGVVDALADGLGEAVLDAGEGGAVEEWKEDFVVDAEVAEAADVEVADAEVEVFGDGDGGGGGGGGAGLCAEGGGDAGDVEAAAGAFGDSVEAGELVGFYAVEIGCEDFGDEAGFDDFVGDHDAAFFGRR
jgi:hypothetical protein